MPVPDYRHLFEQAQNLIAPSAAGPPRQVDLRRAISACYYGLFHFIAAHAADEFVGATCRPPSKRSAPYVRAYRSIPHGHLKAICGQGSGANSIFSSPLKNFMVTVLDAQDKRHSADYDPSVRYITRNVTDLLTEARQAVDDFRAGSADERRRFLAMVLFQQTKGK